MTHAFFNNKWNDAEILNSELVNDVYMFTMKVNSQIITISEKEIEAYW